MNIEKRMEIERKVVRHLIRTMKAKGWIISRINDGGEPDEDTLNPNETEAMDAVFAVDDATIYFKKGNMLRSAYIVLGNDGWDCIADHSCSQLTEDDIPSGDDFEAVMDEVQLWCDVSEDC